MSEEKKEIPAPAASETGEGIITIEDLMKVDIRIGTVRSAEAVRGSTKLLRLGIDDGEGERTILAGIAGYYEPGELVGKQVSFIANLKPRKMMGEMSQGMVLAAVNGDRLSILSPVSEMAPGSKVS